MSTTLCKPLFFLYYVYKEWVTSTYDFSMKEATFNSKLAECMQKTCNNLNPRLHKNRSNALICDFYWRLSHIRTMHTTHVLYVHCPWQMETDLARYHDTASQLLLDVRKEVPLPPADQAVPSQENQRDKPTETPLQQEL